MSTTPHPLSESALDKHEAERQFHRDLLRAESAIKAHARSLAARRIADDSRAVGLVDVKAETRARAAVIELASHQRVGGEAGA